MLWFFSLPLIVAKEIKYVLGNRTNKKNCPNSLHLGIAHCLNYKHQNISLTTMTNQVGCTSTLVNLYTSFNNSTKGLRRQKRADN